MPPLEARDEHRPPYVPATITALVIFALYCVTLAPTTAMWDTSEYMSAAYTLSIPHPPGNPLFVLLGRVAAVLPIGFTPAVRINLLAAFCGAASAGLWFLVAERVLGAWRVERWQRVAGGVAGALVGATAFTVWNQSVVNEKVYTISLLGLAFISWLTVRWLDRPDGSHADRLLVLIAYVLGLGYANHMAGMLAAPAVAVAVLSRRPQTVLRWRLLLVAVVAMFVGLTPFAMQPIRAAYHPQHNTGEPTACTQGLALGCTLSAETGARFLANINRDQYGKPSLIERQAPFSAQLGMWWLYFKWQWLRDALGQHPFAQSMLAMLFLGLAAAGGVVHWQRDRRTFWYVGPLMATLSIVLIYYLNFKLGYTQALQTGAGYDPATTEVRDRDYFFLWSFSALSVWVALGLVAAWEAAARTLGTEPRTLGRASVEVPRQRSWLLAAPVLAIAFIPLAANWNAASRRGETFTRDFAVDLLNSVEPYGILVTGGDNDTYPLWYAQEVEGVRKDVTIAVTSLLATDWYVRQIMRRPIYEYDAARGPAIYRGRAWRKPTEPPLHMTLAQADSIPQFMQLRGPQVFRKDSLVATIRGDYLTRDQLVVLSMIRDTFPARPMYFSRGLGGGYEEGLGLSPYLLSQGLARKLAPVSPKASADTVLVRGDGWMDLTRTYALWKDVYHAPEAAIRRGQWVDRASLSVPLSYIITGTTMSEVLARRGRAADAAGVNDTVMRLARATGLEGLLSASAPPRPTPALGDTGR